MNTPIILKLCSWKLWPTELWRLGGNPEFHWRFHTCRAFRTLTCVWFPPHQGEQPNGGGWEWSNNDVMNYLSWERNPSTALDRGFCGTLSKASGKNHLTYRHTHLLTLLGTSELGNGMWFCFIFFIGFLDITFIWIVPLVSLREWLLNWSHRLRCFFIIFSRSIASII